MAVVTAGSTGVRRALRDDLVSGARTLGTITAVGVVCGWLVVGVLARLAMLLLAVLNPDATGVTSDDGFVIGQFTLSGSLNLMFVAGTFLGVLGAAAYAALRGLRVGPEWFRLLSLSVGAGVVVGSQLVQSEGVDFRVLEPLWLAVGLFVLLPTIFVAVLSTVSERLLARDQVPTPVVVAGLASWLGAFVLLPLLVVMAAGLVALRSAGRTETGRRALASPVGPWLLRAALAVVFVLALADLVNELQRLT